jgi:glycosyltransferase involved in cell wall biosynthesis
VSSPRVSVVIPTFNRKAVLLDSIASVQRQSFADLEILVCDDGSTDGSAQAVEALAAVDKRVRWVPGAHCGFPGEVRNRGIRAARGEWIAFQDSDDLWVADKLEKQLAVAEADRGAQFIYSHAAGLRPDGRTTRMTPFRVQRQGRVFDTLMLYSIIYAQTVVVRRSLLERVGLFDETMGLRIGEDYELFLRLAAAAPFHFVDEELVIYRVQADSISADVLRGLDYFQRVLESIIERFGVRESLAREALCRIELRRYKHHLLGGHPGSVRLGNLRAALARRPAHPLACSLLVVERLGVSRLLKYLLSAREQA